jgi:ribonuclease I
MRRFQQPKPYSRQREALARATGKPWFMPMFIAILFSSLLLIFWMHPFHPTAHKHSTVIVEGLYGDNGCYPLNAQKLNKASVPGDFDFFILSRHVVSGVCAIDPGSKICMGQNKHKVVVGEQQEEEKDIPTKVKGFWAARRTCHEHKPLGFYWPQYCAVGKVAQLNATAFGMLLSANPTVNDCLGVYKWPKSFCSILDSIQHIYPDLHGHDVSNWNSAWSRHGTCSGYTHPEEYFKHLIHADEMVLLSDHFNDRKVGPSWPMPKRENLMGKSYTLKELLDFFGGAYGAGFHCQRSDKDGKIYLTSVTQCLTKRPDSVPISLHNPNSGDEKGGSISSSSSSKLLGIEDDLIPTNCPRWITHEVDSCKPADTVGGAQVWLGVERH